MNKQNAGLSIFFLFAISYFISNVFRGMNVAFSPYLIEELHLNASNLGLLTSLYFISFALSQIPAGIALDRWGPRRTHAFLLLICAMGGVIYAFSTDMLGLMVGRILIGIGIAVALAGSVLIYSQRLPLHRLPLLTGLAVAIGGLGGVVVGAPLTFALNYFDWSTITVFISVFTLLLAGAIWFFIPDTHTPHHLSFKTQWQGTLKIFKTPVFWRWVSLPAATGGMFYAAHTLWVRPFMGDVLGYSSEQIAFEVSIIGISMVLGTIFTGSLARTVESWGVSLHYFSAIGMLSFVVLQLCIALQVAIPATLIWFIFGFSGSSWTVNFASSAEIFPKHILGRVTTSYNVIFFASIFLTQVLIGYILDIWEQSPSGQYPSVAYLVAGSFFLVVQLAAAVVFLWPNPLKIDEQYFAN